jgi:hypothetical protein
VGKYVLWLSLFCVTLKANTVYSYTGSLLTSEDVFEQTFTLASLTDVTIETFGFGGGTNGSAAVIPPGGFDSLVALFSGSGAGATILTDTFGNPLASADTLSTFAGNCPPAGTVTIGTGVGSSVCGDAFLEADNLAPGTYTLLLSDANYVPTAVNPGPPASSLLSDGFTDFTGGAFQTCNLTSDGYACITTTNNYAVDLIEQSQGGVPEPASWGLLLIGLAAILGRRGKQNRRRK